MEGGRNDAPTVDRGTTRKSAGKRGLGNILVLAQTQVAKKNSLKTLFSNSTPRLAAQRGHVHGQGDGWPNVAPPPSRVSLGPDGDRPTRTALWTICTPWSEGSRTPKATRGAIPFVGNVQNRPSYGDRERRAGEGDNRERLLHGSGVSFWGDKCLGTRSGAHTPL